jgi:hypothetical protein
VRPKRVLFSALLFRAALLIQGTLPPLPVFCQADDDHRCFFPSCATTNGSLLPTRESSVARPGFSLSGASVSGTSEAEAAGVAGVERRAGIR